MNSAIQTWVEFNVQNYFRKEEVTPKEQVALVLGGLGSRSSPDSLPAWTGGPCTPGLVGRSSSCFGNLSVMEPAQRETECKCWA